MKVPVAGGSLEVLKGDITEQNADAVVNAANNHFWMGAGVAGAIKKRGGQQIETEAVAQGPVEVGGAVITSAGNLKAKHVIHAAGMGQDLQTDENKVKAATRSSLELAENRGLSSIAFPAIGTGVGGLEIHLCAKIMINEALDFLLKSKKLKDVRFVLFDNGSLTAFEESLRNIFSAGK